MLQAVKRAGSLSGAARALGRSQPAVSVQMKALARELGAALFRAGPGGLELTGAGELFASYAERVVRLVEEGAAAVRRGESTQTVRVAASSTPGVALLPGLLGSFHRRVSQVRAQLEVRNSEDVEARVAAGLADLGVVGGRRTLSNLGAETWGEDELVLALPARHRLAGRAGAIAPRELESETLLLREAGSATRATIEAAFLRARAPFPRVEVVGSTEAIKAAVAAGLGVGILSRFSIARERRQGELAARRLAGLDLRRPLLLLLDPKRELPEAAQTLLVHLRAHAPRPGGRRRGPSARP
jgi:DNA-binding transcriptional LysR family regulator